MVVLVGQNRAHTPYKRPPADEY
uniref:Uncharacterized protein n=1 Tax=Anguilla anguilla TaxID=7936 RepID=A0A0E9T9Q8_ANGAN